MDLGGSTWWIHFTSLIVAFSFLYGENMNISPIYQVKVSVSSWHDSTNWNKYRGPCGPLFSPDHLSCVVNEILERVVLYPAAVRED